MIQFSRQEKLTLLILSTVAVVILGVVFWANFSAQQKLSQKEDIIIVQVDGAVKQPGIYKVKEGTRIFELLEKAGGTTENAVLNDMNLAQPAYDGQRVFIPSRTENTPSSFSTNLTQFLPQSDTSSVAKRVNVNTASKEELISLPGIGEAIAQRIIEYRQTHGPFHKPEDLLEVKGIGPKKLDQIRDLISF
ncbi:MAG: ComEA family DNA-binding protein [Atribacterota bacterium]|nr:ComEA family DNA-binding protein [Atribacterota bacterium]